MKPTSKYILNLDELKDDLIEVFDSLQEPIPKKEIEFSPELKRILNKIKDKLPEQQSLEDFYSNIKHLSRLFGQTQELKGDFHIDGQFKNIPAIQSDYEINFKYNYDVYICALEFSQSGWKKDDRWSLLINNDIIFDNTTTKEVGDKKYFHTLFYVPADTEIKLILHNNSGNSRQVWVDLEYVRYKPSEHKVK